MIYGIIYCVTNHVNGKQYIGQTIQPLSIRWKEHLCHAKHYDFPIYRAIRKYGACNFDIAMADTANSKEELDRKETEWIMAAGTMLPNGYNAICGSLGNGIITNDIRLRLSDAMVKRWTDQTYRAKMKASTTGKTRGPFSEEHLRKLSQAHMGKKHTAEQNRKVSAASKALWKDEVYAAKARAGLSKLIQKQEVPVLNVSTGVVFRSANEAARQSGAFQQNITKCCQGTRKRAGGCEWAYAKGCET
jgi:group I intron endonuclease